jgi:Zn-finger nucleic acid-binding protein
MYETKKCEYCGKNINIKYNLCPLCGGQTENGIESLPPVCPRCKTPLEIRICNNEEYDVCNRCGGMWLDKTEFQNAARPSLVYREETKKAYRRMPKDEPLEYIPCVRCGKLMNRRNFGRISGVIIDECGRHGIWLDTGELEKIRHFIADGGLERSQDREIEKTQIELRDLATKVEQTEFTQKVLHFWNFKKWLFGG